MRDIRYAIPVLGDPSKGEAVRGSSSPHQNIEIKVRCPDLDLIRRSVHDLGAEHQWTHRDVDTYFRVPHGRLKLRQSEGSPTATLIAYDRADQTDSRVSRYRLLPTDEPENVRAILAGTLGILTTVIKTRELYLFGHTRIHLDDVEGLGEYVELETVTEDQSLEDARAEHAQLRTALGLDAHEVVPVSYSDLVLVDQ